MESYGGCGGIGVPNPGGIHPDAALCGQHSCFRCGKAFHAFDLVSYCEEWYAFLHDECIDAFLSTPEGRIIVVHEHEIIRR